MRKLLIGGKLVEGARTLDVTNPATGRLLETISCADEAQLNLAISAAKKAFPSWAAKPHAERSKYLLAMADAVEGRKDDFVRALTSEQGKPTGQASREVMATIGGLRGYAALDTPLRVLKESDKNRVLEHRTPLGVVAAIAPWNFPLMILTNKIAPALISGNTVIGKPAPTTPITALMLGEIASEILPEGVLSIIVDNNDLGAQLSSHPDVAKVSFTGSTATGKKVMASGADSLKRITLELGGNDAALVLDDADIGAIAPKLFATSMFNSGQVCIAVKRIYAPRDKYDELCDALAKLADEAIVDDGSKQGTQFGPVQNKMQFEKLQEFLQDARESGKIIAGGESIERDGYFIRPTIVRDVPDDAKIVREEQFGPILPVLAYDEVEDAIERINDTEYGLGGSVWSSDVERATDIAMRIDSGTVWVNQHIDLPFDVPFGGAKQSGIGREKGLVGLEEYSQPKVINVALN
ncbi:MAG: aldehyde dehydrogenase [Ponticaulis sp.]|nr:aldehyde dehydrogenase [Ponticaulis sp.]|tara:strand:- start:11712 stop:13112 length:1401 start_codon:yes stop_codon:yes gene_type:complete